jgi:hypothetical protein
MQILKPSSVRGDTTTWRALDPRSGAPVRVRRVIDIDGDEHWSLAIQRGGLWVPVNKYCGRNRETSQRIKQDFGLVLYEVEDMPSPEPHCDRRRLALHAAEQLRHEHYTLEELRGMQNTAFNSRMDFSK